MSTVSINHFLSRINFKQVAYLQALGQEDWRGPVSQTRCEHLTALVFIDGTVLFSSQPLDYFLALAHGRMLDIPCADSNAGRKTEWLVPLDAVHHLELVSGQDDEVEAVGQNAGSSDARIIYRAYDPACPARHFQIPVPVSLIDDLLDRDEGGLIDIGGSKFVFAGEVENARPLEAKNIARLAQCEDGNEGSDKPPVSIVELSDGAFIPSSFHVQTVEGMVQRPLPSAFMSRSRYKAYREAGLSA